MARRRGMAVVASLRIGAIAVQSVARWRGGRIPWRAGCGTYRRLDLPTGSRPYGDPGSHSRPGMFIVVSCWCEEGPGQLAGADVRPAAAGDPPHPPPPPASPTARASHPPGGGARPPCPRWRYRVRAADLGRHLGGHRYSVSGFRCIAHRPSGAPPAEQSDGWRVGRRSKAKPPGTGHARRRACGGESPSQWPPSLTSRGSPAARLLPAVGRMRAPIPAPARCGG